MPISQFDPFVGRQCAIGVGHALLERRCALDRIDRAGKLDQDPIAGHFEDTTLMPGNQRLQDLPASSLEGSESAGLVLLHEPAVADDVAGENGGKPTLHVLFGHTVRPPSDDPVGALYWRPVGESIRPGLREGIRPGAVSIAG